MSSSALPLYNTDKLIYKSGFFNKFKKTLPIVPWFLRKGGKGNRHLPGSGKLDKHWRVLLQAAMEEGLLGFQGGGKDPADGFSTGEPIQAKSLHSGDKTSSTPFRESGIDVLFRLESLQVQGAALCALCRGS